jgi:hypothetical protein
MKKTIFKLERIMTISTIVWFAGAGLIIFIGYFGIKIFLGDTLRIFGNSMVALSMATSIMLTGLYYLRKCNQKEEVIIEIIDKNNIVICFDNKIKVTSPISDLVKIYTIHHINKNPDVQAEIIFKNSIVNLYDAGNYKNKQEFDDFVLVLEKEFKFTHKKAPFSLRWSKHYVEYINPLYHE